MKSKAFVSAGSAGILASLLTGLVAFFGNDGGSNQMLNLITALLGGGGLLSVILGFLPGGDTKPVVPDGGGGGKADNSFSIATFMQMAKMFMAAKGDTSPGGAKLTAEEIKAIFAVLMPDTPVELVSSDQPTNSLTVGASVNFKDMQKFAQFITQLMQLGPVAETFKTKGWPAYTKLEMVWDASTVHTPSFGADPRAEVKIAA